MCGHTIQRYYGQSLPFGNQSFDPGKVHYLNMEQAIADYAVLIEHLREQFKFTRVVAFGGRYASTRISSVIVSVTQHRFPLKSLFSIN